MHQKKMKTYGGIAKKYKNEMSEILIESMSLEMTVQTVLSEMQRDDSDHGDIQSGWLNGPYEILQIIEESVADFEAKVNADPEFSDKNKQEFLQDFLEPIKDANRKVRVLDSCIMNGIMPPDFGKDIKGFQD